MNSLVALSAEAVLVFGPYVFNVRRRQVLRDGTPLPLGGRALDILHALVTRAGTVLSKQELIEQVWPDSVVEEVNLRVQIAALRRSLGGGRNGQRYIATVAPRGYSFIAPVSHAVETGKPGTDATCSLHNLPAALTPMIGRHAELAALAHQLAARRQITLVGPAGVGKSRLACRLAELRIGLYRDGVWLIDCATLGPGQLSSRLQTLWPAGTAQATLQGLLLLDSAECLSAECRQVLLQWCAAAPQLTLLATSRRPLNIPGEYLHRVSGLEGGVQGAAVQLWISRAQACQPGYVLRDGELTVVADICQELDGLPLAIELLAAQLDVFSLTGLRAQMADPRWLFGLTRRTGIARQQSLAAALDWRHARLEEQQQRLLMGLAALPAVFTFASAACALCGADYAVEQLREGLLRLEEESLLVQVVDQQGGRYRLLQIVRLHALAGRQDWPLGWTVERWTAMGRDVDIRRLEERESRVFTAEAGPTG
ncbi:winged helix-turn-helix domain-containing protein [Pseudomonas sp. DTU_2021_1001937_2_SI_NGA_ILE_001]|uniref:ATP-binding protein n=1 Tax=Pseudomonas sp. DTU_2021_1001937_2_SI_NGA_ILE_001 TaxID=3077589 RepID=UPI0028FC29ED|nr:winged helix-turn-helix domain-containing protein [Pseudomonas sp. DTU_2021_1001937_2_SI_NGA_ILE_001]WNW13936.1 winged helix-turn-helix domain-containing protein [Pseudomonas sp. DTU_2021_1001937_2_SI_NGA_ILE_001]